MDRARSGSKTRGPRSRVRRLSIPEYLAQAAAVCQQAKKTPGTLPTRTDYEERARFFDNDGDKLDWLIYLADQGHSWAWDDLHDQGRALREQGQPTPPALDAWALRQFDAKHARPANPIDSRRPPFSRYHLAVWCCWRWLTGWYGLPSSQAKELLADALRVSFDQLNKETLPKGQAVLDSEAVVAPRKYRPKPLPPAAPD